MQNRLSRWSYCPRSPQFRPTLCSHPGSKADFAQGQWQAVHAATQYSLQKVTSEANVIRGNVFRQKVTLEANFIWAKGLRSHLLPAPQPFDVAQGRQDMPPQPINPNKKGCGAISCRPAALKLEFMQFKGGTRSHRMIRKRRQQVVGDATISSSAPKSDVPDRKFLKILYRATELFVSCST